MPGIPMDESNGGLAKLKTDNTENIRNEVEEHEDGRRERPEPEARELTVTDRLNKRLLESLLQRMNKSSGEFDKFMESEEDEEDPEGESSEF